MTHEFESSTLTLVRDLFIFACFTALSFVDMKELTTDNIVEINGEKWIIDKRYKTDVPFQVKLLDIPLQIIERYKNRSEDKSVFGKINYWTMCKQLKRVIQECGIDKQISYHTIRHFQFPFPLKNKQLTKNLRLTANDLETSEVPYLTSFCIKSKERQLQMQR